ncbi:DEAD/DEAH box helicase [Thermosynechococcus sp. PP42]|uniref:DEAD/DEAH box helicase n=1 Tax=Thermosynechococcus sp. PP42 TaxID=3074083 RepID=UPI002866B194|nr:DEAD/DEAH box helicase [Thermosynechococcus sp. PP42]MDR5639199.1 DEAD/DEAH box helicase [Thermosynechococcus sp. PP42]
MGRKEKKWFDKLTQVRAQAADMLEQPFMRGLQRSVVDKYSDQAHFIYELLQNADDAKATIAKFRLKKDGLYFIHNGSIWFTISDPDREKEDRENGTLGHINAITSIGNSNKTQASIGKFGIGFKAVFQYTQTPHIYDPQFQFKIERFIVPRMLDADLDWRESSETVFFFPFDHTEKQAQESYDEILKKLKSLEFPTLFLSNLKFISFEAGNVNGQYIKEVRDETQQQDIRVQHLKLSLVTNERKNIEYLLMFSRTNDKGHTYSIGYALEKNKALHPIHRPAFCFFPTREETNLNFILHAPFLLTDSREGIKAGEEHNQKLIEDLAQLAADSFPVLRDEKLIDDSIIDIIPYDELMFDNQDNSSRISFRPFYTAIKSKFKEEALLPSSKNRFARSDNAYWASIPRITQIISNEQLAFLTGNQDACWVFTSFGRDECHRKNKQLVNYIDEIISDWLDEDDILNNFEDTFSAFIKKQNYKWLYRFYEWISESKKRMDIAKNRNIFIDNDGNVTSVYDQEDKLALFLPNSDHDDYKALSYKLFMAIQRIIGNGNKKSAREFFARFCIREYTVKDEIEADINKIARGQISPDNFLAKSFKYFKNECPHNEMDHFISRIKKIDFLPYQAKNGQRGYSRGTALYFPTDALVAFYKSKLDTKFLDWEYLAEKYPESDHEILKKFLGLLGVNSQEPSKRDEIYEIILPQYEDDESLQKLSINERLTHLKTFFDYFMSLPQYETKIFLNDIKKIPFLACFTQNKSNNSEIHWSKPNEIIYFPTTKLRKWFEIKPDTRFLLEDEYKKFIDEKDEENLKTFLCELGVNSIPKIIDVPSYEVHYNWFGIGVTCDDKKIDGLEELLEKVNHEKSILLWNILTRYWWSSYKSAMTVSRRHFGPRGGYKGEYEYDTSVSERLRKSKWLLNKSGDLVSPDAITIQELSDEYNQRDAGNFIEFLGIKNKSEKTSYLSEEESRKIEQADRFNKVLEELGISETEAIDILKKAARRESTQLEDRSCQSSLIQEIEKRRSSVKDPNKDPNKEDDSIQDVDDYAPQSVNYDKKLDRAKDRYASELDRIEREEALYRKAKKLPRYSYGWFISLLELECMQNLEKFSNSKAISIRFSKVDLDNQSSRTIVLREPNRFIPPSIEDFSDVRLDLCFADGRKEKLHIESFTVKEFILLGKLTSEDDLKGLDLSKVLEACIEIQNPSFVLNELMKRFRELGLDNQFDMKANLTPHIEFVFGPPGTGKTTYLAEKVLIPMMQGDNPAKVLVLTPTNKAADVLVARIIEKMGTNISYQNWLIRFGSSSDEYIEKAGVCRDRSFDISQLSHFITVTTIARFVYDGFSTKSGRQKLREIEWDAIVIDEASMIPLVNIIYPLYSHRSCKFIIAGDPFQIEPISEVEDWKSENIYTLVGLSKVGSFASPTTEPHRYRVINLETQYRSIPAIGEVFSRFTYDGILRHHRTNEMQRPLNFGSLTIQPINLIKFPVKQYESIYRPKRLESGTPYHIYSALFTFEFVRWLASQVHLSSKLHIGIIAPYRAQASLLNRLTDSWSPKPSTIEIEVGTIHGFQGDECDIIVTLFNPPPKLSSSSQMFLNNQNILNVAISRARDYLFIVMPDDDTEGINYLQKIREIEQLVKDSGSGFTEYTSSTIEEIIWGNPQYLEENTFSTTHQTVNVYRQSEHKYEVRSDDSAIDVQIHEKPLT